MITLKQHRKVQPANNNQLHYYYLDDLIAHGLGVIQENCLSEDSVASVNTQENFHKQKGSELHQKSHAVQLKTLEQKIC